MTKPIRVATIGRLALGVLILAATSWAQTRPPILEQIAKTYGLESFGQIESMRYTFTLQLQVVNLSRSWTWEPKSGQVTYEGKNKSGKQVKVAYLRSQLSSESADVKDDIDPNFLNDNYWLLFPLHAYWDTSATVTDEGTKKLPIGTGSATLVSVKYPAEAGGYTPGDTWDLYVGKDYRVLAMVYHRGGPKKPRLISVTWGGYKKVGSLLISTEHRGTGDGKPMHVFFSNVSVKLTGSDNWMSAQ
jgi:hypothetical protein